MHASCSYIDKNPCMHPALTLTETHAYILFLQAEAAMLRSYTTPHYQAAQESQHMKHVAMKVSE